MLKKDCNNNIDLVAEMQKSKLICINMPETMFSTDEEKDMYCTYWLTKIWGALQIRYLEELQPYELDDILHLKRYHSLNHIKYENGYAKFITKLPHS
ncbi:MAG: hypothetical protein SPJ62_15000 [Inconstantimicrobium porci]|uniref:hypothetical protein n=1 Tax=Inconstantimicrobium porci TaxID=2652291 RepID=UPI002A91C7FD|nr:hypothetical protein [Inconstantimicrobium porci]MDY5913278.1 hypothetical protein [Inconstantimicrobium porci]